MASIFDPNDTEDLKQGEKHSGVNKVIVLAMVEKMKENNDNLREILELIKFSDCKFVLACDLAIYNAMLGLSTHSGKYACMYCESKCGLYSGKLRSLGSLALNYQNYVRSGSIKKNMCKFLNVINPCSLCVLPWDAGLVQYPWHHHPWVSWWGVGWCQLRSAAQ